MAKCTHVKKPGNIRCTREACKGSKTCWQHKRKPGKCALRRSAKKSPKYKKSPVTRKRRTAATKKRTYRKRSPYPAATAVAVSSGTLKVEEHENNPYMDVAEDALGGITNVRPSNKKYTINHPVIEEKIPFVKLWDSAVVNKASDAGAVNLCKEKFRCKISSNSVEGAETAYTGVIDELYNHMAFYSTDGVTTSNPCRYMHMHFYPTNKWINSYCSKYRKGMSTDQMDIERIVADNRSYMDKVAREEGTGDDPQYFTDLANRKAIPVDKDFYLWTVVIKKQNLDSKVHEIIVLYTNAKDCINDIPKYNVEGGKAVLVRVLVPKRNSKVLPITCASEDKSDFRQRYLAINGRITFLPDTGRKRLFISGDCQVTSMASVEAVLA